MTEATDRSGVLTREQEAELRLFRDGPRKLPQRPNKNLIRRNLLTLAPSFGHGFYRLTEAGLAVLAERDVVERQWLCDGSMLLRYIADDGTTRCRITGETHPATLLARGAA